MKADRKSYQQIFDRVNEDFKNLEEQVQRLEKAYYDIDQVYAEIDTRIDRVLEELKQKKTSRLSRRVARFKDLLKKVRRERGYDLTTFSRLLTLVKKFSDNAAEEIFPDKLLNNLKSKIENDLNKQATVPPESVKKVSKDSSKFLMIKNGNMHFLVEYRKKIWQNEVPARKNLVLRIQNIAEPCAFENLPGYEVDKEPEKKLAMLIEKKDGQRLGILVDAFEGTIFLSKKLLKEKVQFVKSGVNNFRPFMRLKGERYFIRD